MVNNFLMEKTQMSKFRFQTSRPSSSVPIDPVQPTFMRWNFSKDKNASPVLLKLKPKGSTKNKKKIKSSNWSADELFSKSHQELVELAISMLQ